MAARRRFSITEPEASLICTALRLTLNTLRQYEQPNIPTQLKMAEIETLLNRISNYRFYRDE